MEIQGSAGVKRGGPIPKRGVRCQWSCRTMAPRIRARSRPARQRRLGTFRIIICLMQSFALLPLSPVNRHLCRRATALGARILTLVAVAELLEETGHLCFPHDYRSRRNPPGQRGSSCESPCMPARSPASSPPADRLRSTFGPQKYLLQNKAPRRSIFPREFGKPVLARSISPLPRKKQNG